MKDDLYGPVPEEFTSLVAWAKAAKESAVARPFDDPGDIEWRITWYRDGQLVAEGMADRVDRDRGLQMFHIGAHGFGADMVEVAMDAHATDERFQERFGRLPDPGELQQLCDNEGACEIGLTTDCIVVSRVWRDGHAAMINLPYHVDRRREQVEFLTKAKAKKAMRQHDDIVREGDRYYRQRRWTHWIEDRISTLDDRKGDKYRVSGRVYEFMRGSFQTPSLLEKAKAEGIDPDLFGLDPQVARWHTDMATVRVLTTAGFAVAVATTSDEHAELVRRSLAGSNLLKAVGMDGNEVDLSAERAQMDATDQALSLLTDLTGLEYRQSLDRQAQESHAADLAEAERRRAARPGGTATQADKERVEAERKRWS